MAKRIKRIAHRKEKERYGAKPENIAKMFRYENISGVIGNSTYGSGKNEIEEYKTNLKAQKEIVSEYKNLIDGMFTAISDTEARILNLYERGISKDYENQPLHPVYDLDNYKACKKCGLEVSLNDIHHKYKYECRDCVRKYDAERMKNRMDTDPSFKEAVNSATKAYQQANKDKVRSYQNTYVLKRRNTDPLFKLTGDIRGSIGHSFRSQGYSKKSKTADILGCSFEELQLHLGERTSNDHIDHIIPQSRAITEDEIYTLNHYSNLQILSAAENIAKGNRFTRLDNVERVLSLHNHPKKVQEILDRNQDKILA